MPYTVKDAQVRIPEMLKRIALLAIEGNIALDTYAINSHNFEIVIFGLQGCIGDLTKLFMTVCKATPEELKAAQQEV